MGADAAAASSLPFLVGGGSVGALMRAHDWSASPLGPPERWPQSLRSVVGLLLNSKFPMFVAWGPELGFLYNDPYAEILGSKHPGAVGRRFDAVWPEIWADISPLIAAAMAGEATYRENLPLVMNRKGFNEQTWFTFSYSPVRDESGTVAGMFCACTETTAQVLGERRQAFRLAFEEALRGITEPQGVMALASELVGRHLGIARVGYGEIDDAQEHVIVERDWTDGRVASVAGRYRMDDFGPPIIAELKAGRTMSVADTAADPRVGAQAAAFAAIDTRAVLAVSLIKAGRLSAMLFLHHPQPRRWSEDEARLVEEVAERTWSAVERARAEAAVRKGEQRFRTLFDNIDEGFCVIEFLDGPFGPLSDYVHVEANPAYTANTGIADIIGKRLREIMADEAEGWLDIYRRVLLTGEPVRFERELVATGRRLELAAFRVEPSERRQVAVLFQDVTARRRAEAALRESEARFRNMADHAPVMMWVTDSSGYCTYLNRAWYEVTGQTEAEGEGFGWLDASHPDDRGEAERIFRIAVAARAPFRLEYRLRQHDGTYRWAIDAASPRFGADGAYLGYIGSVVDIHERKLGEEALARRVAEEVAERARAEEALRQAQKMEAMGQLTGGVAHDFNNLLTPIIGSLDMLQRQRLGGAREQRLIAGAMQSAERAKTLVQRLLAFARRQPLQAVAVDIAALVTGMGDLVASTTGPQIKLAVEAPGDLPPAMADPNQLEMALLNLSVNARDAMPDGGTLRITATTRQIGPGHRSGLRPGTYVCLSVADTGTGMDEATRSRAVEPFFSTKGVGKGTGLGLSMVHGLALQLGGALSIRSRPGLGTNVELWLPQSAAAPDAAQPMATASSMTALGTALLVDDEEIVRLSTADMLNDLGYGVIEAASAEEAMQIAERGERFDLLVTDHLMAGMNGTDLARSIRAMRPQLPVLLVSGYAEHEGIEADLPRLAKPFRKDELGASLARLGAAAGDP